MVDEILLAAMVILVNEPLETVLELRFGVCNVDVEKRRLVLALHES